MSKARYDDILLAIVFFISGILGLKGVHPYASGFAIFFGVLLLSIRVFHLTHKQGE